MFSLINLNKILTYKKNYSCYNSTFERTFPSQTPAIYGLSQYSSISGTYVQIEITGDKFVYGSGLTNVYMALKSNASIKKILPISYLSSTNLTFIIPSEFNAGEYNIRVAVKSTIQTGNGMISPTTILFSNTLTYTLI